MQIVEPAASGKTTPNLVEMTKGLLSEVRTDVKMTEDQRVIQTPIAELLTLGSPIAEMVPEIRKALESSADKGEILYRLLNADAGDSLKTAKNGDLWGAIRKADKKSAMARFEAVESASEPVLTSLNPAAMMMAVALCSVERDLKSIEKTQAEILSFLDKEKESEIEADVETLSNIVENYKHNWDNDHFVSGNHKLTLDIQRTARKNMLFYQKEVEGLMKEKQFLAAQANVKSKQNAIRKKFRYYRLSLYSYSLASFSEILLSGNRSEGYIAGVRDEIGKLSAAYEELYDKCAGYLQEFSASAIDTNVMKGLGSASKAVGSFLGKISPIKNGPVDEFLQSSGEKLEENAHELEKNSIKQFSEIKDSGTKPFTRQMDQMIRIFNHTSAICLGKDTIYLLSDKPDENAGAGSTT